MAKGQDIPAPSGRLLDAWIPPEGAGEPMGCIATSFTFDSVFFEEECLGRFLHLESDPAEDGPIYLLEREEKLAQLQFAAAVVDQHHCVGRRSLRWDLIPARVPGAVLHAKVCLLRWSGCVRLIIGSANLTPSGYRVNQEVFGVVDYTPDGRAPLTVLEEVGGFLENLLSAHTEPGRQVRERASRFVSEVREAVAGWSIRGQAAVRVGSVLTGPGQPSVAEQLQALWPGGSPPVTARVVSPFFDRASAKANRPAEALWDLLRKRGEAHVKFHVTAEDANDDDGSLFVHAPASLVTAQPSGRRNLSTTFYRIETDQSRPLHAKCIWLEGARWISYMIGSSNFTSPGLGLNAGSAPGRVNVEANLVYIVDRERYPTLARNLADAFLSGSPIDESVDYKPDEDKTEDEPAADTTPLPLGFQSAVFSIHDAGAGVVELTLGCPPAGWVLAKEDDDAAFCTEVDWASNGAPQAYRRVWSSERPPSGFWVTWRNSDGRAWWPVSVDSPESLPPPEELKDLPLEVLIDILTSARPLHRNAALKRYLARRPSDGADDSSKANSGADLDPHRRVNTSRFLLQRTRRVGWALCALRERVERPVYSEESLNWRLRGPVGVRALAAALIREAHSDGERAFLLAELALELHRVQPQESPGSLPARQVIAKIADVVDELQHDLPSVEHDGAVRDYVANVFQVIRA